MKNSTKQDTFAYRISHEELFFVLNTLQLNTLPGLGSNPFSMLSAEQTGQMLASGFNSLRAKGWVQLLPDEEHPFGLDRLFVLPILVCASSRNILSITKQTAGQGVEKLLVFRSPNILVMYRLVEIGLYEFVVTASRKDLLTLLIDIAHPEKAVDTSKPEHLQGFSVPHDEAGMLMNLQTKKDVTGIRDLLKSKDVHTRLVESYISTLEKLQQSVTLSFTEFPEQARSVDDLQGHSTTLLVSPDSIWAVEDHRNKLLTFKHIGTHYLQGVFSEWIGG